jgi:predicted GTPase
MTKRKKVIICGAAGRDFHNFNMLYRHDPNVEVIAFTATQIPNIDKRLYPAQLAGALYPHGIPIRPERELISLCKTHGVDEVVFAYSDVSHDHVMNVAATANAADSALTLVAPRTTMLATRKPAIAVCAVRTGCGKSQATRFISQALTALSYKTAVLRHPMPYGDLTKQNVQRFEFLTDLDQANCTLEEREEYEPHIQCGGIVFAGVDY